MKYEKAVKLFLSIIVCELAGVIGSVFTTSQINLWYVYLKKPSFNPPNWIFGPVWTILFVLMGISLFLVLEKVPLSQTANKFFGKVFTKNFWTGKESAVVVFAIQLILNIKWSFLFFAFHSPALAFVEIIFLWLAILWTIFKFYKISKNASYLLIPYILWVSFASFLNLSIWLLNT